MPHKTNKIDPWAIGVDELDSFEEGVSPVRKDSYSKLAKRLDEPKRKRRRLIYLLAACTTGTMLLLWLAHGLFRDNGAEPVNNSKNIVVSPKPKETIQEKAVANPNQQTPLQSRPVVTTKTPIQKINHPVLMQGDTSKREPDPIAQLPMPPANRPDTALAKVNPEKLPIGMSHINKYTDVVETTPGIAMRPQPMRRFLRERTEADVNAAASKPLKPHTLKKSPTIQN